MRVDPGTWREVFDRDRGYCRYCGLDLLTTFSVWFCCTVDHVIAVSAGGPDDPANLVLSCPACNSMLSRSGHLRTFEDRKTYVTAQRKKRWGWYSELLEQHRGIRDSQPNRRKPRKP